MHGCSRTDAGVSAREFYCTFAVETALSPAKIKLALLALLPHSYAVFVLAVYYLFFSLVVIIRPNHRRSIVTYGLFCATMLCMGASPGVSLGCMLISLIVIDRHLHARLAARRAAAQTD